MALVGLSQSNPIRVDEEKFFIGKNVTLVDVDFGAAVNGSLGPAGAVEAVFEAIQGEGVNILGHGPLHSTNANMSLMIEGEYGSDTYDGSNSESLAAHLEDVIKALGTVDGINLGAAGSSVTAKTFVL
jgi:hypothetical protein